jgi:2-keto-4-pentenoate hydratase
MSATLKDPRIAEGMRAQMQLRRRLLDGGARQIGWKVGLGAPAMRLKLGLTAPIVGFLLDRALLSSGATVSLKDWQKPVGEAEIAAHIGRDLPAHASRDDARKAIAAISPAIELADADAPMDDVRAVLAGDIFQRHVILGPRDTLRAGGRLDGLKANVKRSGTNVPVPAALETNTGDIIDIVRHVADVAAAVDDGLRAGQFIICGSLTPPMLLEPDERGVDYTLEPIGTISVKFST